MIETLRKTRLRIQSLVVQKPASRITVIPTQERILQILAQTPRLGGGELARSLHMTRSHMSKILQPLVKAGLVKKDGSTKAASYRLR